MVEESIIKCPRLPNIERPWSNSGYADITRDFTSERPGTCASHNETPRIGGIFDRLGPMPAYRDLQSPFDAGRLGSKHGSVDAYRGIDETMG